MDEKHDFTLLSKLKSRQLSLLVNAADGKEIFSSKDSRLKPLIECIIKHKQELKGALAADKVVGLAAAKLFFYAGFSKVYALTISKSALNYLRSRELPVVYEVLVENICNKDGAGICPMEKMSLEFDDEEEFFKKLKEMMNI